MVTSKFDVEFLRDLIAEGYEGQDLLEKFTSKHERVHGFKTAGRVVDLKSDFDVDILRDLIAEKFTATREKIPAAFAKWMNDLIKQSGGKTYTLEECFSNCKTN